MQDRPVAQQANGRIGERCKWVARVMPLAEAERIVAASLAPTSVVQNYQQITSINHARAVDILWSPSIAPRGNDGE
jgi:hypothetical protein